MDISVAGCGNEVRGGGVGGYVRPPLPEYLCPLYFHLANTGAMSKVVETVGGAGG